MFASAKFLSARRRISTTGSGWRHSHTMANSSAAMATAKKNTMKLLSNQSSVCPRSSTTSRQAKAMATEKIPHPSIFNLPPLRAASTSRVNSGGSDSSRLVRISETMPIGMLMKNTHRHVQWSVIQPPKGGPIAGAVTMAMLFSANAAARFGGGLAPVEQAILVDTFPPAKRAAAFALYSMAIVPAPAIGPPLGGWITDHWTWRWVFFINIPIGIVSLILTSRLLSDPPEFTREVEAARKGGRLKIDGWGIFSVAMAFACLEVVLDRGQTEDWFESNFIVFFFAVAMAALLFAIVWEWRHPDPVVEIRLLADRNFALANIFYFIFGFTLYGSTVLIPQMLQRLFGYSATDAGLVLGPGAFVIVMLAPVVVRILPKTGVKALVGFGYFVFALAMWYYASFTLATDYRHEATARALQGLGIATLFVPVSQLAYSNLPKNKNNKASSLTNLFRNQGGSFGIAFVTTLLARRTQYHQSVLVAHATPFDQRFRETLTTLSRYFLTRGFTAPDAALHAKAQIARIIHQQAAFLGFLDCFWLLGCACLIGAPLVFFTRKVRSAGSGAAH